MSDAKAELFRPRCVVIVGDGFSQGVLRALGLSREIRCMTGALFDQPDAQFKPGPRDTFAPGPLWREELFPLLLSAWRAQGCDAQQFLKTLGGQSPINPDRASGMWTYHTHTVGHQLRAYLWHLFAYFERVFDSTVSDQQLAALDQVQCLSFLCRSFETTFVSYNYDMILDRCLCVAGRRPVGTLIENAAQRLHEWPAQMTLALKPHGCIRHATAPRLVGGANQWLVKFEMERGQLHNDPTQILKKLEECPWLPDLVPPGHSYEHLANPNSTVESACCKLIARADIVVSWGVAADEPDTPEFHRVLSPMGCAAAGVQIGLAGNLDWCRPIGRLLRHNALRGCYWFVDAGDLRPIIGITKGLFDGSHHVPWREQFLRQRAHYLRRLRMARRIKSRGRLRSKYSRTRNWE